MANIWRFTVEGHTGVGDKWNCNLHYETNIGIGGSEPDAATVLDKLMGHFSSSGHNLSKFAAVTGNNGDISKCSAYQRVRTWEGEIPTGADEITSVGGTNTASGDVLPQALCVWIKFRTGVLGRSFRGGTHAPPSTNPSDLTASGNWQTGTTYWTAMLALAAAIVSPVTDYDVALSDLNPVIYSETRRRRDLDPTQQIVSAVPQQDPRWLRRRMIGHGS